MQRVTTSIGKHQNTNRHLVHKAGALTAAM